MWSHGETRVLAATGVDLNVTDGGWAFADRSREEIDQHWELRTHEKPGFFNGVVHLMTECALSAGGMFSARFVRTDFKSFLYWRETGWCDQSVMDAFGSALILSADGQVLLGRQSAGHLNSGLCYPPSGFIDVRDIGPDGRIDIDGSVAREIAEETGLAAPAIARTGGYVLTFAGPVLSIAVPYRSPLPGAALLKDAARHISAEADSELADLVLAAPGDAAAGLPMPDYARVLLGHLPGLKSLA
ncbi:NUDIX hydrolase [Hyphomicrobium sp.]|uniref:NUDIX hydrolase n=1 Tax=Hyphomicrobium sp. TaxID=82 RepID=UPI0025BB4E27|nr:NUDIX hydrolase [Hyphomicrobium sp.]MCC7252422.1 NUDIX domain-containing protein [Hyphomicrobium sp.]